MVTALPGRPATKRSHLWSAAWGRGRTSSPYQVRALGSGGVRGRGELLERLRGLCVCPTMLIGLGQPAPPDVVATASAHVGWAMARWISRSRRCFFGWRPGRGGAITALPVFRPLPSGGGAHGRLSRWPTLGGEPGRKPTPGAAPRAHSWGGG